ncbi:P1 family peptidase [Halobacillus sp. A1]|uniref:P1 family peptidase n=1 Tax=Halobacillus sp. A1 TaxID=2880262 RepID=UPI0020A6209E|nr:P1 family peptidase [Halobacillus sp. A1]MCP3030769.1 P1 family peptidase [Halobacillus sp. A1]
MHEIHIQQIEGFELGHAQSTEAGTGCTVILSKSGTVAGVDVRGGAPGTRETDLLKSENLVQEVHGVFLSGGSAYGLAVGQGVMNVLEQEGAGFNVGVAKVPIVPGAILFDLAVGASDIRPDEKMGEQAALNALGHHFFESGNYGAGTGASVGKILGFEKAMKGGLGHFAVQVGELKVGAVIAVNSFGDIVDPTSGERLAGAYSRVKQEFLYTESILLNNLNGSHANRFSENTTIGTIITNASMTKAEANKLASMAHDGLAVTMKPSHTFVDGDTLFTMSTNEKKVDLNTLGYLFTYVVERAVINAVQSSESAYGLLSYKELQLR